jgi:hypothetical protein
MREDGRLGGVITEEVPKAGRCQRGGTLPKNPKNLKARATQCCYISQNREEVNWNKAIIYKQRKGLKCGLILS